MPGDQTTQRRNLASEAATAAAQFITALETLISLSERRPFLGDFVDADFAGTDLAYLDPYTIGVLFDFVVPSLRANYEDADQGRNEQILNQVSKT